MRGWIACLALALASALAVLARAAEAPAQTGRTYRLASVSNVNDDLAKNARAAFGDALRELGYAAGGNLIVEEFIAEGDSGRLPGLVDQAIATRPDVLLGWEQIAVIMHAKTRSIPIVLTGGIDPVQAGLAESLARPGKNVTGVVQLNYLLPEKHIDMMRQINPRLARVGLLVDSSNPACRLIEDNARRAAEAVGAAFVAYPVASQAEIEQAFTHMKRAPPDLLLPCPSPTMQQFRELMIASVLAQRIAFTSFIVDTAPLGVLFSYAESAAQRMRRSAYYVDKVLKGARPGDLPIEQPARLELVVNLQTARALGLTLPLSVLARADPLIE